MEVGCILLVKFLDEGMKASFIVPTGLHRGLCCQDSADWQQLSGLFVLCCVLFAPSPLGDNSHSAASSTPGHRPCLWKFISMAAALCVHLFNLLLTAGVQVCSLRDKYEASCDNT